MKIRILAVLFFALVCSVTARAQDFVQNYTFVKPTVGVANNFANTGVSSFAIFWSPSTTVSSCSVQVDSSADGITWGTGDLIFSQNCAVAGSTAAASLAAGNTYVRVNLTVLSGNGGVNITLKGWGGAGSSTAVGPGTPTFVSCFSVSTNVANCGVPISVSGGIVNIPGIVNIGGGAGTASVALPSGSTSGCQTPVAGTNDLCSDGTLNTLDEALDGGPYAPFGGGIVDSSLFTASTWLAQAIAAANSAQCNGKCTVTISPAQASTTSYPSGTLPSGVTYEFVGPGSFGVCSITSADPFFKMLNPGNAVLQMNPAGSGCTALSTTAQASLQTNDHALVDSVRVNCEGQTGSSGIVFPNTARLATQYNNVTGCTVVGIKWSDSQFVSSIYDMAWSNYANIKIYNVTGGGNSNAFWHLIANNPTSGVNVIVANQQGASPINGQGDIDFYQPEFQNGTIAQLCVFGDTTNGGSEVHIYGGAFELGGGGASSITIDGNTCKQASIYGNQADIDLQDQSVAEATVTPLNFIENHSYLVSTNNQGYGNGSGTVFNADSTSLVLFIGKNWWPNGTLEGGAGTFIGAPTGSNKYASCPGGCATASGTLTSNYAIAGAGTSVVQAENSLLLNASNTNSPAAVSSAVEYFIGRTTGGGLNSGQSTADMAFQDGISGGGFRNFIMSTHNASTTGSEVRFYLNTSSTAAGSSAPGTGNVLGLAIEPYGAIAPNFQFNATGSHIFTNAASSDVAGTIAIASATSAAYTFATNYVNAPNCTITPLSNPTSTGVYWVTTSTTAVTAHVASSGTISFTFHCFSAVN